MNNASVRGDMSKSSTDKGLFSCLQGEWYERLRNFQEDNTKFSVYSTEGESQLGLQMDGCDKAGPRVGLLGTNYTNRWVATHVTRVHMYSPEVLNVLAWFPEKSGLWLRSPQSLGIPEERLRCLAS